MVTSITGSAITTGMIIVIDDEGSTAYSVSAVEVNSQCVYAMITAYGETRERRFWNDEAVTLYAGDDSDDDAAEIVTVPLYPPVGVTRKREVRSTTGDDLLTAYYEANPRTDHAADIFFGAYGIKILREAADLCGADAVGMTRSQAIASIKENF